MIKLGVKEKTSFPKLKIDKEEKR